VQPDSVPRTVEGSFKDAATRGGLTARHCFSAAFCVSTTWREYLEQPGLQWSRAAGHPT